MAASSSNESNFRPHTFFVNQGQDIGKLIEEFVRSTTRDVCILSGEGTISVAKLESFGTQVTYEGMFSLVKLSGMFTTVAKDGEPDQKSGVVNVCLANNSGNLFGGRMAGVLVAAGPVCLVMASYIPQPLVNEDVLPMPPRSRQRKPKRARAAANATLAGDQTMEGSVGEVFKGHLPINHYVTFERGQDIAEAILYFANCITRNLMVVSAQGRLSYVEIASPHASDDFKLCRKGDFGIVKLSASLIPNPSNGDRYQKIGGISVILSDSNGDLFGGEVVGPLVARGALHVIFMSFENSDIPPNVEDIVSDHDNHELQRLAMVCHMKKSSETRPRTEDKDSGHLFSTWFNNFLNPKTTETAPVEELKNLVITSPKGKSSAAAQVEDSIEEDSEDDERTDSDY